MTTVVSGRPFTGQPLACNAHPWAVHNGECIQCLKLKNANLINRFGVAERMANELAAELTHLMREDAGTVIAEPDYPRVHALLERFRKVMP